jgi:prepilin-type N-terminal cleavage/methylation domain-containing protein
MKGFTLVEILVATLILTLLIMAAFQVMEAGRSSWFTGDTSVQLRQEIIKTFIRMERELKETRPSQINLGSGTSGASLIFRIPQDNNADGTILDANGNVEWSDTITYALNGANQITRTASGNTTIIANNVIGLQFTRPVSPVNILQIDITVRKTSILNRIIQDTGQIMVKMRN